MNAELFDTHTHLDAPDFDTDRAAVIQRARDAGVTRIVTVGAGYGLESASKALAIAESHDFIWSSAGLHPHDVATPARIEDLRAIASSKKVVAIGETGLDFYRDWSPRDLQDKWFRAQIGLALELGKPLIIHSRQAGAECLAILRELGAAAVGGVFHCYSEDQHFAEELRRINFMVSFPGSVTFKKADALRAIVREIPIEQIMVETDAPYLAPEPYRGKRCESSYVVETAKAIAAARGLTFEQVASQTTENALKFFRI